MGWFVGVLRTVRASPGAAIGAPGPALALRQPATAHRYRLGTVSDVSVQGQPVRIVFDDGSVEWHLDGVRHREDGPAYEAGDVRLWYRHGVRHRDGGPAIERPADNYYVWYSHGRIHRDDGPAHIRGDVQRWLVHGQMHRIGGPAHDSPRDQDWVVHGALHRLDGPAQISGGCRTWWVNGDRVGGPEDEHTASLEDLYANGRGDLLRAVLLAWSPLSASIPDLFEALRTL